jgi:hypothetical protein
MKKSDITEIEYKVRLTKRFIIDMLNAMCFSATICWDGNDQFHQLPIFNCEEENKSQRTEQRGAILVHKAQPHAVKLLVTAHIGDKQQVCYRLTGIDKPIDVEEFRKTCYPIKAASLDFSMSDTELGIEKESSYCFSQERVFLLLKFLLDSHFLALDDKKLFKSLLNDAISFPPVPGDLHFKPVYAVIKE